MYHPSENSSIILSPRNPWITISAVVIAAIILSWPAFYNGYPFLISDSNAYLISGITLINDGFLNAAWSRPSIYGYAMLPFHLLKSLWPIVFVQGLIIGHLIYLLLRIFLGFIDLKLYAVAVVIVAIFTSLSWFVSQISPDLYLSIFIAGLFLLGFAPDKLSRLEKVYLFLLSSLAISLHFSFPPIAIVLAVIIVGIRLILKRPATLAPALLVLLMGPIVLGSSALFLSQSLARSDDGIGLTRNLFLLARSIHDGPALSYLQENCPEKGYLLCDHLNDLNRTVNGFMWDHDSPLYKIGIEQVAPEAKIIVIETWKNYPLRQLGFLVRNTASQLISVGTGEWIANYMAVNPAKSINQFMRVHFPGEYDAYAHSRQNRSALPEALASSVHRWVAALSFLIAVVAVVYAWRKKVWIYVAFFFSLIAASLVNAVLAASFSNIIDRYQSRLVWLLVLFTLAAMYDWWRSRRAQT